VVGPTWKVTILLADSAQAVNGKLYILGGGWSLTGPEPLASALAIKIDVPWDEANRPHELKIELLDTDGHPFLAPTPMGEQPLQIGGKLEVGRPAGLKPGTPLDVPAAFNLPPLPLKPDMRYVWRVSIDDHSEEDWQVSFTTRPAKT
jgi:hypothetical protein